ncbi:MAG: methyltransferase domain-containing protein [Gaiella sp.]|nr:methyltransferase domain-containing protein [Gaiella sp.]
MAHVTSSDEGPVPSTPFGVPELVGAVAGARRVLDVGCGSGRLTVALARAGAEVTGMDTSAERLAEARRRAEEAGVPLTLVEADMGEPLPFADASFDAVTSRLSLMVPRDAVPTLRELRRVLAPGGRIATVVWAALPENPWFDAPREAVRAVLGDGHASFARAFGRLGDPADAERAHRESGLEEVAGQLLREHVPRADATEHWRLLATENAHFRRIDAALGEEERRAVVAELEARLLPYRTAGRLELPRTLVLVTASRPG